MQRTRRYFTAVLTAALCLLATIARGQNPSLLWENTYPKFMTGSFIVRQSSSGGYFGLRQQVVGNCIFKIAKDLTMEWEKVFDNSSLRYITLEEDGTNGWFAISINGTLFYIDAKTMNIEQPALSDTVQ